MTDRLGDPHRRYVGTYLPRVDGLEKASGRALYVDDVTLQKHMSGLLYAKVLRSPHPHARITRLDTSAAEALPGVVAVLRYDDPEVVAVKANNAGWTPGSFLVSYDRMFFPHLRDRRVLENEVRWVGDLAGVAVAAETEEIAEEALRLVEVEWDVLPFVLTPEEALAEGAPLLHPDVSGDSNVLPLPPPDWPLPGGASRVMFDRGDLEKAYEEADLVLELEALYEMGGLPRREIEAERLKQKIRETELKALEG